ncbi:MAG: TM1812 family CRISPR-associated protein [Arcobacteraceae bacterium]|jgi:CRISPR-associated DxTHG motif protein|nr:TM1812 family CRISPR-associated protein [Arcobacteraceae bacterium]
MSLRIVKKANKTKKPMNKQAVITILGIQGGYIDQNNNVVFNDFNNKAKYYFENESLHKEYFNTLPLLIEKYYNTHTIIPIFTEDAKIFNQKVLSVGYPTFHIDFKEEYLIEDEKDYKAFFNLIDRIVDSFDEVIVDVSHGFRHLPILMIVDLIIQNFQNTQKVQKIIFAKEIIKHLANSQGLYEIIDLKEYLELANIAFILTNFEKNYTVASHIKSDKYKNLIDSLNGFSNDLMALNIGHLQISARVLINELDKINDVSIYLLAQNLKQTISILVSFENKKRYLTYFELSKELFEKNYMLISLALLFESIRFFIRTSIKKQHKLLVAKIEQELNNDDYKINQFFKNLKKPFDQNNKNLTINENEYYKLQNSFPSKTIQLYSAIDKKRNTLAHANSNALFTHIQYEIDKLIKEYELLIKN